MDFNRKIALIILAGLLASLFGSFSFLMAMETVIIKDFAGQAVQLDDSQRTALRQCQTLKDMLADTGMHEVPFEGVAPFITAQNLHQLAHLVKDEKYINQIPHSECIELFKCADYMKAPSKALGIIADRIYEPLHRRIIDTVNKDEKANLEILFEAVESHLSYYPDLNSVLKNKKVLRKKITGDVGISLSSGQKLGKKLKSLKKFKSLEGIEALSDQVWTQHVKDLRIEGHEISYLDFASIRKAFPVVTHMSLENNDVRHISHVNASNVEINLKNNPFLGSIAIDNPRSLKNTKIVIDKGIRPIVTFNQSRFDKCAAWLEALKAQSKVALNRPGMKEELKEAVFVPILASIIVNSGVLLYESYKAGDAFKSVTWSSVTKSQLFTAATFTAPYVLHACISKMWRERNQIRLELARLAYNDGNHVNVCWTEPYHHGDTRTVITYSCPSKYAYNLFGKN